MVELTNTNAITLQPGQQAYFDRILLDTGNCTCTNINTGTIKMKYQGIYEVQFNGNIASVDGTSTVLDLAISTSGSVIPQSTMESTPSAADQFNNIGVSIYIRNCCGDYSRLAVVNNGTNPLTIGAGALFSARKVG